MLYYSLKISTITYKIFLKPVITNDKIIAIIWTNKYELYDELSSESDELFVFWAFYYQSITIWTIKKKIDNNIIIIITLIKYLLF